MFEKIRRRPLGETGLNLSELGMGTAPLGNLFRVVPDDEVERTMSAALKAGINYFDTAPYYGSGLSERRVGDHVRGCSKIVISTKVGRLLRPMPGDPPSAERDGFHSALPFEAFYDYTYDGVMRSWEASLQRLGLAQVDILLVHDVGTFVHGVENTGYFAQLIQGGGLRALEELRSAGAIKAIGVGVNEWQICLEIMQHARLDIVLLAGRYTLLDHASALANFFPACARDGVRVVAGGVYNSGILATGTGGDGVPMYDYAPADPSVIERVRRLEQVCRTHGVGLPSAALQFSLGHPVVVSAVLGLASCTQVDTALKSYEATIPSAFWDELKALGLIDAQVPLPWIS